MLSSPPASTATSKESDATNHPAIDIPGRIAPLRAAAGRVDCDSPKASGGADPGSRCVRQAACGSDRSAGGSSDETRSLRFGVVWLEDGPKRRAKPSSNHRQRWIARVPYPKYVFERIETGTLCLSVNHPDFVPDRPERIVATAPGWRAVASATRGPVESDSTQGLPRPAAARRASKGSDSYSFCPA